MPTPVPADTFRVGVNYWPAETAFDWLVRYDPAAVRRDLTRIAETGMDTVRIFVRWEDLQPAATTIEPTGLAAIVDVADAAEDADLQLIVTLFTGHMSGVNWIPTWATGGDDGDHRFRVVSDGAVQPGRRVLRNWYTDTGIIDAQARLADRVASALAGHPAVWAWDLGNDNSNYTIPPDPDAANRWLERMSSVLRSRDPRMRITIGTHMEDLENDRLIGPAEAGRWCDFVCMHGYPVYADWSAGVTDEHLVPFLAELTSWLAADAPLLFAEFGQSTAPRGELLPVFRSARPTLPGIPPKRWTPCASADRSGRWFGATPTTSPHSTIIRRSISPFTSERSGCGAKTAHRSPPSKRSVFGLVVRA